MNTPLKLTFYNPETSEIEREFRRSFVPWKMLKRAAAVSRKIGKKAQDEYTDDDYDALSTLICDVFGNRFTVSDLDDKADLGDMMAVMKSIVSRASGGNPTMPG
jgi:hypothetical protein